MVKGSEVRNEGVGEAEVVGNRRARSIFSDSLCMISITLPVHKCFQTEQGQPHRLRISPESSRLQHRYGRLMMKIFLEVILKIPFYSRQKIEGTKRIYHGK